MIFSIRTKADIFNTYTEPEKGHYLFHISEQTET